MIYNNKKMYIIKLTLYFLNYVYLWFYYNRSIYQLKLGGSYFLRQNESKDILH